MPDLGGDAADLGEGGVGPVLGAGARGGGRRAQPVRFRARYLRRGRLRLLLRDAGQLYHRLPRFHVR